jgi:carbamoyl-phosphate synthase large subunit
VAEECAAQEVHLVGADATDLPPARAGLERFELLPLAREPHFAEVYADVLAKHDIAAFLTIVDPEIPVLGSMVESGLFGERRFLHPPSETSRICEDKYEFHEVLSAHGVPTIPTYLRPPRDLPYIRKDRTGSAASGFAVVMTDAARAGDEPVHEAIYQPFIGGQHYCVDAYFSLTTGELIDCCVKEVLAKQAGETYVLRSFPRDDFVDLVRRVGEVLPMRGIVNLDVYDMDGTLVVMEVNCRIGGNYPASHALGANLLRWAILEGVTGETAYEWFSDYPSGLLVSKFIGFSPPYPPVQGVSAGSGGRAGRSPDRPALPERPPVRLRRALRRPGRSA